MNFFLAFAFFCLQLITSAKPQLKLICLARAKQQGAPEAGKSWKKQRKSEFGIRMSGNKNSRRN